MTTEEEYGIAQRLARVEQRVDDLNGRLTLLRPLESSVSTLTERVDNLRRDLAMYAANIGKMEDTVAARESETHKERRDARVAMWGLTATIVSALIVAAVTLIVSLH